MIAADARFAGTISCPGDLHIDGIVNGDSEARSISVGTNATVIGTLQADEVMVAGTVHGGIAANTLLLTGTARVFGQTIQERLTIEPGGQLEEVAEPEDGA